MAGEKRRRRQRRRRAATKRMPRGHRNGKDKQDTSDEDYVLDDEEESTCDDEPVVQEEDEEEDTDEEEEDTDEEWTEPRKRLRKGRLASRKKGNFEEEEDSEDEDWIESRKRLGKGRLVSGSEDTEEDDDTDEDEEDELDTDEDNGEWIVSRKRSRTGRRARRGDSRLSSRQRTRKSGKDTGSSSSSKQEKKGVNQRRKSGRKRRRARRGSASSSREGKKKKGYTQRRKKRKKQSNGGRERFMEIGSASYENKDVDLRRETKGKEPVADENVGYDDKVSKGNVDELCGICLTEVGKAERGTLDCCDHYFCYICIMEWAKVESRCPMCKQRFMKIVRPANLVTGRSRTIRVPLRNQVYVPSEDELIEYEDPYANVVCMECHEAGEERLLLLCDLCDAAAHTYCVGLGRSVPRGDWFCRCCQVSAPESSLDQDEDLTLVFDTNPEDSTASETPTPVAQHGEIASARSTTLSATVRNPRRRLRRRLLRQPTHHTSNSPLRHFETVSTAGDQTAEPSGICNPQASAQQTDTARTVPNQRLLQERIQNIHERWEESQMGTEELPSVKCTAAISPSLARAFSHEIAETYSPSRSHEIIERSRTLERWEESQMGTEELPSMNGTTAISCSPSLARAFSHEIAETSPSRSHEITERSRTLGRWEESQMGTEELPSMNGTTAISCSPSLARAFIHEISETSSPSRSHEITERSRTLGRWEESQMATEELPSMNGTTAISCFPSLVRAFSDEIDETSSRSRSHEINERSRTLGRWEESQMGTEESPSMNGTTAISCFPSLAQAFSDEIAETSSPSRSHEINERSKTLVRWEESQMGTEELPSLNGTTAISCSPSLARAFSHKIAETSSTSRSHEIIERSRTLGGKNNRNQTQTELPRRIVSTLPTRQVTSCKEEPDVALAWTVLDHAKVIDGTNRSVLNLGKNEFFSHLFNRQQTYGATQYACTAEASTTGFQNRASSDEPYKFVLKKGDLEEKPERGHDIWHSRRVTSNGREEYLEDSRSANSAAGKVPVSLFDKRNESSIQASENCGSTVLSRSSGVGDYGRENSEKSDGNALAKCSWQQFSDGKRLDDFQCGIDRGHSILRCAFPFLADTFEAHKAYFQKKYHFSAQETDNLAREGCTCMHGSVNPCVHNDKTVIMQGAGVSSQEKQRIASQVAVRATCENASDHPNVNEKTRQGKSMKAHILSLVKVELWPIYLSEGLSKEQFKEIARSATHALLAMFDLEHHKKEFELKASHCCHGNSLGQSLIGDFCESCLKAQVQVVVQTISRRISSFGA